MSLLGYEDFESINEELAGQKPPVKVVRWEETTVRRLVAISDAEPGHPMSPAKRKVLHEDMQMIAPLGDPVECPDCHFVAVRVAGAGDENYYPHGAESLFTFEQRQEHRHAQKPLIYCPHCDGGEDAGGPA